MKMYHRYDWANLRYAWSITDDKSLYFTLARIIIQRIKNAIWSSEDVVDHLAGYPSYRQCKQFYRSCLLDGELNELAYSDWHTIKFATD